MLRSIRSASIVYYVKTDYFEDVINRTSRFLSARI